MPSSASLPLLRVLVIGAGPMAEAVHLPILAELKQQGALDLTVVCDLDPRRAETARTKFGFAERAGDAVAALARPDIDVVYIFAGAQIHADYGRMALESGKHLFVEKPIAPSFAEAQTLAILAAERGRIAVGGHNRRFLPALLAAHQRAGRAGWRSAEAVFHKPMLGKKPAFSARSWLSANGIHALDALLWQMGGPPEEIAAASDGAHVFSALMRWEDGRQASFVSNNMAGERRESYALHMPGASLAHTEPDIPARDSFVAEHRAFLDAIRSGEAPPHALAALAPALFLCERIEEGFSGRILLPAAGAPTLRHTADQAILLCEAARWQPALGLLSGYRLVSPEAVGAPRPDIAAALLGRGAAPLSVELLARLPNLKVVGIQGLSMERYGAGALLARGVTLVNASDAHAESVAEFALGLAILGRRRAFPAHEAMRKGGWGTAVIPSWRRLARAIKPRLMRLGFAPLVIGAKRHLPAPARIESRDLSGATAGLIGWGANARAFTARLQACGVRVLVHSTYAPPDLAAPLDAVLAADIVSLHRALTPATRHTLGAAELARMRPGTVLINIARGGLIDESALVARLRRGDIFACLDSYEEEPLPPRHPLRRLANVFLTPHIAGGSPDMLEQSALEVAAKVRRFLTGDLARDSESGDALTRRHP